MQQSVEHVGPDDEVLTTSYTFASTALSIIHRGGTPVFADIEPDPFNISPAKIEEKIQKDYRATEKGLPFYDIAYPGFKANLTDIQAARGVVQIRKLERINRLRNQVAEWYDRFLGGVEEITIPVIKEYNYSARHLYPILLNHEETPILSNSCPKGTASVFNL